MHRILFVDRVCPRPYDGHTLETRPQGGSESSVTRVAEALAARGHHVRITQHNRTERADINGVEHTPFRTNDAFDPTHVVAFRDAAILSSTSRQWPASRGYAWYQDFFARNEVGEQAEALVRNGGTAVVVSEWHRHAFMLRLLANGIMDDIATERIYNPIPDDLHPDGTPVDPDKFLFFSSPHKGLEDTLAFFARFADYPELRSVRLYVANPGYHVVAYERSGRVVELGCLPWKQVIRELRGAFMVLHYNRVYPETFGIVHAEADAVGTPWISGSLGANVEIASHLDEVMDLDDAEGVIRRIIAWRANGRIQVRGNPEFRLSAVADAWEAMLARGCPPGRASSSPGLAARRSGG
ncbi:MAG TPA: hypothetical protein VHG93_25875 [Longimicrobium sp.]|nr:hypothetical protein [Longimicrobium sp.]